MKSAIMIKSLKKYKKYNSSVTFEYILLTGYEPLECNDVKINSYNLVKQTCLLGKSIYNIIKEENKNIPNPDQILMMKAEDPKDVEIQKKFIKNYIENFKNIENKNHTHYNLMFKFYKKGYELLKNKGNVKNVTIDMLPITIKENINKAIRYYYENFELDSKTLKKLNDSYNEFLTILSDNIDILDLNKLMKETSYIPLTIENFYKKIYTNGNGVANTSAVKIFKAITTWCEKFGMPFWTERIKIGTYTKDLITTEGKISSEWSNNIDINSKSNSSNSYTLQEYADNTVPINGLIVISLIIYLYYSVWEEFHSMKRLSKEKERELELLKTIIGADTDDDDDIMDLIEKSDQYYNYIMNNFNCIRELKLNISNKKARTTQNGFFIFYNIKQYESSAIAAWDVFYHDYLGNSDINSPLPYCNICHKEIYKNPHFTKSREILCNNCYKKRAKELQRLRTQKFREKNQNNIE